jgi:predicted Zn-dependent peptidase
MMWLVLMAFVIGGSAAAQKPDRSAPPKLGPPPVLRMGEIQHLKLANGLKVILYEKHSVPLVQINLLVRAGSVCDPADEPGLASMTGSMMMEGAGNRDALALSDAVDYLGAGLGVNTGYHTFDVSLNVPVTKLDSALSLMADVALRPTFSQADFDRKKTELLTSLLQWRDVPRMLANVLLNRSIFGGHPYGIPSIGTEQSLQKLTPVELKAFHEKYFVPTLATLVVVGDVTASTIMPKLKASFGKWKGTTPELPRLPETHQVDSLRILLVDKPGAPQSVIIIGRVGVPRLTPDYYPIVVLNSILGGSFSSRLNMNLRERHGYTYGAGSRFDFRPLPGPLYAVAAVQSAVTDSSLIEFMNELRGIVTSPPSDAEVERARNFIALSFPSDFQTVNQIAGQLEEMALYNLPDDYFNNYIDRILSVTTEQTGVVAKKYIDPSKMIVVIVGDRAQIEQKIVNLHFGPVTVLSVDDVLGKAPVLGTSH